MALHLQPTRCASSLMELCLPSLTLPANAARPVSSCCHGWFRSMPATLKACMRFPGRAPPHRASSSTFSSAVRSSRRSP
eukprot:3368820-Amphidinium_carterae.1